MLSQLPQKSHQALERAQPSVQHKSTPKETNPMKKKYIGWRIFLPMILMLGFMILPVCAEESKPPVPAEAKQSKEVKPPKNAATVNGETISYKDFSLELEIYTRRMAQQGRTIPDQFLPQIRSQLIDEMINALLLVQSSKKEGISVKKEDVEKEMDAVKARYPDPKAFQQILDNMKLNEAQLKEKLTQNMMVRAFLDKKITSKINVSEADAKAFYDSNPSYFQRPEQVRARHILKRVEEGATEKQKAEARKALEKIKKKILAGEDFAELAKEHSDGPTKVSGGDLGYFAKGKMVKPFAEAAFALKPNEVSDIVETKFGYHIIKVLDHRDAETMPFEDAKKKIQDNLKSQKANEQVKEYLAELRKKAKIENFIQ
jgi:peptidyl-prolyl cis-trans isomerase C